MAKILLIDDDNELRSALRDTLSELGYEVTDGSSGGEALTLFNSLHPDLLIIDLMMPEKDGLTTIQELLRDHPRARIIAMSGGPNGNPSWLPIAKSAGAMVILKKPFSTEKLNEAVSSALENPWR